MPWYDNIIIKGTMRFGLAMLAAQKSLGRLTAGATLISHLELILNCCNKFCSKSTTPATKDKKYGEAALHAICIVLLNEAVLYEKQNPYKDDSIGLLLASSVAAYSMFIDYRAKKKDQAQPVSSKKQPSLDQSSKQMGRRLSCP